MDKSNFKKLIAFLAILMFVLSCQRDDICPEVTPTTPNLILRFYDAQERENPAIPTNLSIRSIVNDSIKTLYQRANKDSIPIPLRTNLNTTTYTFTIFDPRDEEDEGDEEEDPEFRPNTDTLSFTYGTEEIYVNRACAYKVIYNSLKVTIEGGEDGQWIDSYIVEEPDIEDETQAHISIFF